MALTRRTLLAGALAAPVLATTGCAGTVVRPGDLSRMRIMAPASPGGGWDTTARLLQRVIRSTGIARNVQVFNVEGAGGTIGLGQLSRETDDALLMMMGLVMVGAVETNDSAVKVSDVTPVARLIGEAEIIVVPGDSQYDTLEDFVAGWKDNPARHADRRRLGRRHRPDPGRAAGQGQRTSTRSRSTTSPTPAAASRWPRCSAARSRPGSPGSASTASRCWPAT